MLKTVFFTKKHKKLYLPKNLNYILNKNLEITQK